MDRPFEPADGLVLQEAAIEQCVSDHAAYGIDAAAYNTREATQDLELFRQHVRADELTLWATSYGSHLALDYVRMFPDRVAGMVLHGVEGPDHTLKRPQDVDRGLVDLSRRLAAHNGRRDWLADVRRLVAQLERHPHTVRLDDEDVEVVIGPFDLQSYVAQNMGTAAARFRLTVGIEAATEGDYMAVGRFARAFRQQRRQSLMSLATDCASGASSDRMAAIEADLRTSATGNAINYPFPEICGAVPHTDLGADFRAPVRSDVRALFVSGTLDGRTPVSNAEEVLTGFPNAQHLIVDGAGHVNEIFVASPMIQEVVLAFLRHEPLPTTRITVPFP